MNLTQALATGFEIARERPTDCVRTILLEAMADACLALDDLRRIGSPALSAREAEASSFVNDLAAEFRRQTCKLGGA